MKTMTAAAALAAVIPLAACGSAGHHSTAAQVSPSTAAPAVSTSAALPPGCGQVSVVVGTVRGELENAPQPRTYLQAEHQLASLGKSVPASQLKLDVDRANLDLSFFVEKLFNGQAANKDAKSFATDLQRLDSECGGGM